MYIFPDIEYRNYLNSFLSGVTLFINYKPSTNLDNENIELREKFKNYLERSFNITFKGDTLPDPRNAFISKKNNSQTIAFQNNYVIVNLNFEEYENFNKSVIPVLYQLKSFFTDIVMVEYFTGISISKTNQWDITTDSDEIFSLKQARELILSENYLAEAKEEKLNLPDIEFPMLKLSKKYEDDRNRELKVVIQSLCRKDEETDHYSFVLISIVNMSQVEISSFQDLIEEYNFLNKNIYDAFHWAISPVILNIMEGKIEE